MMSGIQNTIQNVEVYYFYTSPNINLLRYYDNFFTFGGVMINKIQTPYQNIEVYYFCTSAMH